MNRCITGLAALLLPSCAGDSGTLDGEAQELTRESEEPIIDGAPVDGAGRFQRWEGIVQVLSTTGSCTGAFITGSHVLSAGHCFPAGGEQAISLRAPTWDGGGWHYFERSRVGVRGTSSSDDVAVITLPAPVPWATSARRFRLLAGATRRESLNIYGYGAHDQSGSSDGALREPPLSATIEVVEERAAFFRADVRHARICWGDSGGPAMKEGTFAVIWGVAHSFSYEDGTDRPCPTPDHEMTWTKVNANLDFIERQIGFPCSRFRRDGREHARCW